MTTSNTPDQRIDSILDQYRTWCYLGDGEQVISKMNHDEAKTALKLLFETMMATALGQDYLVCEKFPTELGTHCNNCFACSVEDNYDFNRGYENKTEEVRQRIPQVIRKYFNTEEK